MTIDNPPAKAGFRVTVQSKGESLNALAIGFLRWSWEEMLPLRAPPSGQHSLESGTRFLARLCDATSLLLRAGASSQADETPPFGGTAIPWPGSEPDCPSLASSCLPLIT